MKFLDLNGLTYFFSKVKTWAGNNYLSLKGGTVNGDVEIDNGGLTVTTEEGINLKELNTSPRNVSLTFIDGLVFSQAMSDSSDYEEEAHYNSNEAKTGKFVKNGGTSTQALIADGSVKEIGSANGIAGLDSNGYVPLSQLGNLDTTVAEVVTALPTTNIKKHIYLIRDTNGVTQNQYEEYIYTGDTSAAYDDSKWEKLGDFRATVDLADYAKKSETISDVSWRQDNTELTLIASLANGGTRSAKVVPVASSSANGVMSNSDKMKLDKLDMLNIRDDIDVSLLVTAEFNDVTTNGKGNYLSVSLATVGGDDRLDIQLPLATDNANGIMSASNKVKLDGISSGATADSAITTGEIDALFA